MNLLFNILDLNLNTRISRNSHQSLVLFELL